MRVLPGRGAEVGDGGVGGEVPVWVKPVGGAVEKGEPGKVGRAVWVVVEVGVQGVAEVIGGQQVRPVVADNRRPGRDGVEGPLQAGPHSPLVAATAEPHGRASAVGGLGEVEQVGAFGFVKLESAGDRVQHGGGDAAECTAFKLGVILDAHPSQVGDLAATQPRDPAAARLEVPGPVGE